MKQHPENPAFLLRLGKEHLLKFSLRQHGNLSELLPF